MTRVSISLFVLLLGLLPAMIDDRDQTGASAVCNYPLTRVVTIPVRMLDLTERSEPPDGALTVSQGAVDELPEGPTGFDVLEDGSFVITDPLRSRISEFDSQGSFRKSFKIGFAADSVTLTPDRLLAVEESSTGKQRAFDLDGQPRPKVVVTLPEHREARVLSDTRGTVARATPDSLSRGPIEIRFESEGSRLLSLMALAGDGEGNTFVALESTVKGEVQEQIDVSKYVRKYRADGVLAGQIADLPLTYYVVPVDELRVHDGKVYQLQPTKTEVKINVWDTKQACGHS